MPKVVVNDTKGLFQESGSGVFVQGAADGATPAYIALTSADGTVWYLSVADDGEGLMISAQAPNGDESVAAGTKGIITLSQA